MTIQRNRVKTLDAHLNSRQAQVLNVLLVWVASLGDQPSTRLLQSVLFFTFSEDFLLADQIATTCSPVLMINKEGRVGFKDGLRDILTASDTSDSESPLSQLHNEAISGAEVNLCRQFIKNACEPIDYARFRFDDFFEAMAQKDHIHLDDRNTVNSQTNSVPLFDLAQCHENEKNHRTALKYIQTSNRLADYSLRRIFFYKIAYQELLLTEGNCYQQFHDCELGVKSYQNLLSQDIDERSGMRKLQFDALVGLFATWTEIESFQFIIEFICSWKDEPVQSSGLGYWLWKATHANDFHMSIIVAAEHAGAVGEIIYLYQKAIDYKPPNYFAADELGIDSPAEATEQLRYFQAILRYHGSKSWNDQNQSIQYWEKIVQRSDENPALYMTASNAACKLAPILLDKAVVELLTTPSSSSENYISRLEKLANLNTTVVCRLRQGSYDLLLCLLRL